MTVNVYAALGEVTSPVFAANFAEGCGGRIVFPDQEKSGPWAGFGSPSTWKSMSKAIMEGHDWWYGDHAYFRRRLYYRITKNAFQHSGYGKPNYERLDRFNMYFKPWIKRGKHIVLCAQSQSHFDRHGVSDWIKNTAKELSRHTDRPIIVREKRGVPLEYDLQNAWAVVVHTSNAAVDAAIMGIPTFVTAPCAASRVSKSSLAEIESPLYADDRREWAGVLAANQWTFDEIRAGMAWAHLQGNDYANQKIR